MPSCRKTRSMKSFLSVVQLEFQRFSSCSQISSMESSWIDQSTLMRLLHMVLLSKLLSLTTKMAAISRIWLFLTLHHFLKVSKLLEASWLFLSPVIRLSQQRRRRLSLLTLIINLAYSSRSTKERGKWRKIIICLENSSLRVSLLHLVERLKSKLLSTLMRTVSSTFQRLTRRQEKLRRSLSPTIKVAFRRRKSRSLSLMQRNSRLRMMSSARR